jgi:creatinine amidohydrolase
MAPEAMAGYPFDHAGEGETSLMMALCPEGVDLARLSDKTWYTRSAAQSSAELGGRGRDLILARLRKVLARA